MARILAVDDDPHAVDVIRCLLERRGDEVWTAGNGVEAEEILHENEFDLALVDIIMPVREGIETIMCFARDAPEMKIVAVSGGGRLGPMSYLDIARKLGADCALSKPFGKDELLGVVDELVGPAARPAAE